MGDLAKLSYDNRFKDGEDEETSGKILSVKEIVNGYVVNYITDEDDWEEPYRYPRDNEKLLKDIKDFLGI